MFETVWAYAHTKDGEQCRWVYKNGSYRHEIQFCGGRFATSAIPDKLATRATKAFYQLKNEVEGPEREEVYFYNPWYRIVWRGDEPCGDYMLQHFDEYIGRYVDMFDDLAPEEQTIMDVFLSSTDAKMSDLNRIVGDALNDEERSCLTCFSFKRKGDMVRCVNRDVDVTRRVYDVADLPDKFRPSRKRRGQKCPCWEGEEDEAW